MNAGIHSLPSADYHADPCETPSLSASLAKILVTQSPAHARANHPRLNPFYEREDESKFELGTAAHALFFEGDAGVQVCHYDNWTTKAAQEERHFARMHGKIPMLPPQWEACEQMVNSIRGYLDLVSADPPLFHGGKAEQTVVWEEDGLWFRSRVDYLHDDLSAIDDLKTTSRSARGEKWSRGPLYDTGAHIQAAMYRRGIKALTGQTPKWRWVVVETTAPYALSVVTPREAVYALAEDQLETAIATWRRCLETDTWPAYPPEIYEAELPPWEEARWLERQAIVELAA